MKKQILTWITIFLLGAITGGIPAFAAGELRVKYLKEASSPQEVCYEGVTYVNFDVLNSKWGGVKMTREGKVIACESR